LKDRRTNLGKTLRRVYQILDDVLGPQHWWPGNTPFEVIVGAILTQSTAWSNVEKAIRNLRRENALSMKALHRMNEHRLAKLIRPSGYFRQKAKKLKNFLALLSRYSSLRKMMMEPAKALRAELLAVKGIGPETADSILLYAAARPVFVVDAYTRRILSRHGWITEETLYDEVQDLFHRHLPPNAALFNQYHALLVRVGKDFCWRTKPQCAVCPLEPMLPAGKRHTQHPAKIRGGG
jgi:endonuclease-3 related protein